MAHRRGRGRGRGHNGHSGHHGPKPVVKVVLKPKPVIKVNKPAVKVVIKPNPVIKINKPAVKVVIKPNRKPVVKINKPTVVIKPKPVIKINKPAVKVVIKPNRKPVVKVNIGGIGGRPHHRPPPVQPVIYINNSKPAPVQVVQPVIIEQPQDLVEEKKQYVEEGKIIHFDPLIEQNISFLGFFNKYLSGNKNGKFELKTDKIGSSEIFTTIPITEGIEHQKDYRPKVCIKLYGTDLFVCCEKNGELALREHVKKWEEWIIEKDEKTGMFAFKSHHNTFLCADKNGKPNANRKKKGEWEKWTINIIVVQQEPNNIIDVQQEPMAENDGSYY